MMMRRKKKRSIAFLLVCALLLVGCSSGTSGETDAIKAAKQKVQALGKEPKLIVWSWIWWECAQLLFPRFQSGMKICRR